MPVPNLRAADFQAALQALKPPGRAWPQDADALQNKFLAALSLSYERHTGRSAELLADAFPSTAVELLPEWEETLGLPDPCAGASPTIVQRQAQVVGRLAGQGGQSVPYFIAVALALGYAVTITQFAPARIGDSTIEEPLKGTDWAHAWQVNAPTFNIYNAEIGASSVGDPLRSWDNTVLQCELQRLAPAHTVLIFSYS